MKQSLQVIITLLNLKIIASNTTTYRYELGICYKDKCMCGKNDGYLKYFGYKYKNCKYGEKCFVQNYSGEC